METKNDVLQEISGALGIAQFATTVGSSVPRSFFTEVASYFNVSNTGTAIAVAKRIIKIAGKNWAAEYDSSKTPSGGGGTITLEGLIAIRDSVNLLLDIEEGSIESPKKFQPVLSEFEWTIFEGQRVLRSTLHERYGGSLGSNISRSEISKNILLFSEKVHVDQSVTHLSQWTDSTSFQFLGDEIVGDTPLDGNNRMLLDLDESDFKIRLFKGTFGSVVYQGEFKLRGNAKYVEVTTSENKKFAAFNLVKQDSSQSTEVNTESKLGKVYEFVDENLKGIEAIEPFTVDENLLDKSTTEHGITQNGVARWLQLHGIDPLSPNTDDPQFDIAWSCKGRLFVAEIKSINDSNEMHQFRLGLGQVLDYAASLSAVPILILSAQPKIERFEMVASRSRTTLLWPEKLAHTDPHKLR